MATNNAGWSRLLTLRLSSTMMPGEKLSIVELLPYQGRVSERWQDCWPGGPNKPGNEERASPLPIMTRVNEALLGIYNDNARLPNEVLIHPAAAPRKDILGALLRDSGRYSVDYAYTTRVILYSDMAQNAPLGSVFEGHPQAAALPDVYLTHSVFYVWGFGDNVVDDPGFKARALAYWENAFSRIGSALYGIGLPYDVPEGVPVASHNYDVTLDYQGRPLPGKISLLTDKQGALKDSWIGISHVGADALEGEFKCSETGCYLYAKLKNGLLGSTMHESIALSGETSQKMAGNLQLSASLSFSVQAVSN